MENIVVFSKEWFKANQRKLLWACNGGFKLLFRRILKLNIDAEDNQQILEIGPSFVVVELAGQQRKLVSRTYPIYARRLYSSFSLVWKTLHFWDQVFADRLAPELSFGFSTLTVYPDPGSPGATTSDGNIRDESPGSFATKQAAVVGSAVYQTLTTLTTELTASAVQDEYSYLGRALMIFDTSTLVVGDVINSATLSLYPTATDEVLGKTDAYVVTVGGTSTQTILIQDYGYFSFSSYAGIYDWDTWEAKGGIEYYDLSINRDFITKGNVTRLGLVLEWDYDASFTGSWVSGGRTKFSCYSADQADVTTDPKLVVIYNVAPTYASTDDVVRALAKIKVFKAGSKVAKTSLNSESVDYGVFVHAVIEVTTVESTLPVGPMDSVLGYIFLKNLASSGYISVGPATGNYVVKLKAGECALFRCTTANIYLLSSIASSNLEFLVTEAYPIF